jgi:mono/diheme cytochrome c family protein
MKILACNIAFAVAIAAVGGAFLALRAQAPKTVWDGVYNEAQATRGAALYDRECAECHGPGAGGGGMAPSLTGLAFTSNYDGLTVDDLFDRNRTTMPAGKEGGLTREQNADITAFMLQVNGFPAGSAELPTQSMLLKQIAFVAQRP